MTSTPPAPENPNAFKHWINKDLLKKMGDSLRGAYPDFDHRQFLTLAPKLESLELKPRVRLVRDQLHRQLPPDYKTALRILLRSSQDSSLRGFDLWPYTEFIQAFGLDHPELSLKALRQLTPLFTGEFAVRPFLKVYPAETIAFLKTCAVNNDPHVRRWASEGSRPRLPWGERLDSFIKDPSPTLPVLEALKYDEELYVRKSVANHLNDIAKDHPELLVGLLKKWKSGTPPAHQAKMDWIIHRSLRTLIKNGHPGALKLAGANPQAKVKISGFKIQKKHFKVNEKIEFGFTMRSLSKKPQKLIVDYIIHHVKANKKTSPKVFKLKSVTLNPGEVLSIVKRHHVKAVTTRKYYSGTHRIEIQINGKSHALANWILEV